MSIMTYDNQNKKEDLSCYLNDDDSSAEEELLLVAEKLETMQHQEEEARKKVTLPIENDVDHSSHSPTFIRHSCPESTSFDWAPDSSSTIPAPMETNMSREIAAKDVVAIDATDSYIRFEIRNEKSANENSNIPSQNEASIREDEFDKNIDEVQVVQRQESKHPQSPQYRENEKTTPSQLQKQQIIATAKTTIDESEGKNHQTKDKKSLHDDKGNWNNKHSIDGYKSTLAKKVDLVKYVAEHEEQKEVIVDLTKMGSTNSSRDYLDSSDHSTRDRSEMTNLSDCCTSFSSSSSSLSDDSAEAAKLPSNKKSVDIHTYIHRSDLLLQFKSHLDSVPATTTTATRDTSTHVLNNSSATPYDSGITACANGAKGTKQLKVIGRSNGTSSGVAPDDIKDCTTGRPSPGELWRATAVVRNPYLRKSDAIIASVNEAEPILTHDRKNQRPFPIVNKSKKATDVHTNDIDNGNKAQTFRPESSDKKMISTPTTNPTEMRRGDMIIVDKQELGEELESEVSRSLYAPPVYHEGRPPPILHRFDCCNHPLHSRQTIPVGSLDRLFTPTIVNSLWAKKFDRFNHFQSAMLDSLSDSDNNVVVSAPTGAGKSTIFEMAMARFLAADLRAQEQQGKTSNSTPSSLASKARKMVYIAPSKALCEERYADWSRRLQKMNLGLEVALITGQELGSEQETKAFPDLISAHLIVTTPEKWDSMTRRWNENFFLFASIKLLLLDEVHLLGDESRGWCLESIVTRMKTIQRAASALITTPLEISTSSYAETNPDAIRSCFRTVAVSATLPNISEVADFLQANEAYIFDDSYRPVPLTKHVNALGRVGNNEWRFWSNLSEYVPEIIKRFSHGKQSLIFCHSKKETQKVTELLIRRNFGNRGVRIVDPPWNKPVEYMLGHGIGFHHAGMSKDERKTIEEAFLNKKIKCLAATSTLAVGVNLPGMSTYF
jgi:superfamily II DNA/RNA helicase